MKIKVAVSAIKNSVTYNELDSIIFVGCNMLEVEGLTNEICSNLRQEGLSVVQLDNILYNYKNMSRAIEGKCAVIVEQIGKTTYGELFREIEILKTQGITILGVLTVES